MTLTSQFESSIEEILKKTHITVKQESEFKKCLTEIIPNVGETDKKHIQKIIQITASGQLLAPRKKEIQIVYPKVLGIVKKYEEEYETEENPDPIEEVKSVEEVEELLDAKIPVYNGYSKENPMEGITLLKNGSYRARYGKIDIKIKNLEEACQKVIFEKNPKNSKIFAKNGTIIKKHFCYQDHYFMTYWLDEAFCFDIQHVISVLNVKQRSWNNKYAEYKDDTQHIHWHKNSFGGYIRRELINEETMYGIILSSQSTLSKTFKKDVAKILVSLRKNGKLEIKNNSIILDQPFCRIMLSEVTNIHQ